MKILLDFLPIALFFGMFKYAEGHSEWAANIATDWLGFVVDGGIVGPTEAPVLMATAVVIFATLGQILLLKASGRRVDAMLWISLGLVTLLGGATIYFHYQNFIKWKPTLLYWIMSIGLLIGQVAFKKIGVRSMMEAQMKLPDPLWPKLNLCWVGFFAFMGFLNLWVAFNFSFSAWVNFKLFGGMGLMFLFIVLQAAYLNKHIIDKDSTT